MSSESKNKRLNKSKHDAKTQANAGLGSERGYMNEKTFAKDMEPLHIDLDDFSKWQPDGRQWIVSAYSAVALLKRLYKDDPLCFVDAALRTEVMFGVLTGGACEITGVTPEEFQQAQFDRYEQIFSKSAR